MTIKELKDIRLKTYEKKELREIYEKVFNFMITSKGKERLEALNTEKYLNRIARNKVSDYDKLYKKYSVLKGKIETLNKQIEKKKGLEQEIKSVEKELKSLKGE